MNTRRPRRQDRGQESEGLYDERVPIIRWSRVYTALVLIAIAIIWLLLDNHFGLVDRTQVATPTPPTAVQAPRLTTSQAIAGVTVDVVSRGITTQLGGTAAPSGSRYLLMAARISNSGEHPLPVAPSDFAIRSSGRVLARGVGYPGHLAPFKAGVAPGQRMAADLAFLVPDGAGPLQLVYTPRAAHAPSLTWTVP